MLSSQNIQPSEKNQIMNKISKGMIQEAGKQFGEK